MSLSNRKSVIQSQLIGLTTIAIVLFGSGQMAKCQQEAVTSDGKTVILNGDGTWVYREDSSRSEFNFSFRQTSWGMTRAAVKRGESFELAREDADFLIYSGTVFNEPCHIYYIFVDDKLVRAKYVFVQEHSNQNDFLSDFSKLKEQLASKYGAAIEDNHYWSNDLYKSDYQGWGMAVAVGHLSFFTHWDTPVTEIWLALSGENYNISLSVEYTSRALEALEKEKQKKKNESDF